jgi:hypothetical protein
MSIPPDADKAKYSKDFAFEKLTQPLNHDVSRIVTSCQSTEETVLELSEQKVCCLRETIQSDKAVAAIC